MSQQFLRSCTFSLSGGGADALVVKGGGPTDLKIQFAVESRTTQAPDQCQIVITNPSMTTVTKVQKEFTNITLAAGYEGNVSTIFYGSIIETQYGEKVNDFTDTLLRIFAAAWDRPYNQGRSRPPLRLDAPRRTSSMRAWRHGALWHHREQRGRRRSQPAQVSRGVVLAGMARDYLREVALSAGATWNLDDGKVNIVAANTLQPGATIAIGPKTGLIGQPILRQDGIIVRCRINPAIQLSTNVRVDAKIVSPSFNLGNDQTGTLSPSTVSDYEIYKGAGPVFRVLHMQTNGDTRGGPWETELTLGVGNILNAAQLQLNYDSNLGIGGS